MKSSYVRWPSLAPYLTGAAAARAGDEMAGPALLLLGFAVTGRPATGSALLATATLAGAAGGPAGVAAVAAAPGWLTLAAVALGGAGEGPQLTALFAVRHREAPEHMRGQIYTTAASLKIAGMAAGAALAGPLAGRSVTACLLVAAAAELCAAAAYLLAVRNQARTHESGPVTPCTVRNNACEFVIMRAMRAIAGAWWPSD